MDVISNNIERPKTINGEEIKTKLEHLAEILEKYKYNSIVLNSEGAMRWLTGIKHQLGDIAPAAVTPVSALIGTSIDGVFRILIVAKKFELPRLEYEIPKVFEGVSGVEYGFSDIMPEYDALVLNPACENYHSIVDQIVRPLLGGKSGNQYKKLKWLSNMTMRLLVEAAEILSPGMSGMDVRGILMHKFAVNGIDTNLILVALAGQEKHLHPIASADYRILENKWFKLVVGSRYSEQIVSQSLVLKIGGKIDSYENTVHYALQDAAVEYADSYRSGVTGSEVCKKMVDCFHKVEKKYGLRNFAQSALLHHPGGGTSPLGNRDKIIDVHSEHKFSPWTQFAVNPVDTLADFKVELQGIVQPDDMAPLILDTSEYVDKVKFREIISEGKTKAKLPELLII